MISRFTLGLAVTCLCASTAAAQTTTMDFSTLLPFANSSALPQTFGDHANLSVSNSTRAAFGNSAVVNSSACLWGAGYSTLSAVAIACSFTQYGELFFQPTAGKQVTLNQLTAGAFRPGLTLNLKVFDTGWNELFTYSGMLNTTQVISPNVTSSQGLYLQWGDDWNTGLNLVQTTVTDVVGTPPVTTAPEPASFALVAAGLGVVAFARRRQQRSKLPV